VTIKTKPITRLLRFIPVPFLHVHGHNFKISISVKNLGTQTFNGGAMSIFVQYAFGNLQEQIKGAIPSIDAKKECLIDLHGNDELGVLAHGHALFYANISDLQGNLIPLYDEKSQALQIQAIIITTYNENRQAVQRPIFVYQVHTFYSLTRGEIYTLIALYTNILLTILVNGDRIVEVFRKLLEWIN